MKAPRLNPEDIDLVARLPVPTQEAVEFADVGRHTDARCAVERGKWSPARSANSFDVEGNLVWLGAVERLVKPPHIGFLFGKRVSCSVGKQHVFARRARRVVADTLFAPVRRPIGQCLVVTHRHDTQRAVELPRCHRPHR